MEEKIAQDVKQLESKILIVSYVAPFDSPTDRLLNWKLIEIFSKLARENTSTKLDINKKQQEPVLSKIFKNWDFQKHKTLIQLNEIKE